MYWIDTSNSTEKTSSRVRYYICDDSTDILNLPTSQEEGIPQGDSVTHLCCSKGSTCTCISPASVYMLNSRDEWKKLG